MGIDTRPADRNVYALTSAGRLYTVNAATGTVAFKATLTASPSDTTLPFQGLDGGNITVDVSPAADGLRVLSSNGVNLRVLFDTGETFTDTQLNPSGSSVTAAAYTNSFAGTATSTLYVIDTANDRLMIQGRAPGTPINGDLQVVGPLGITGDVQTLAGLDPQRHQQQRLRRAECRYRNDLRSLQHQSDDAAQPLGSARSARPHAFAR